MKTAPRFGALAFLAVLLGIGGLIAPAFGNDHFLRQTGYVGPLETAWVVPTSYYAPTSYVLPTSYYAPTSYVLPTSYYAPTSYYSSRYALAPTSYVLPSYFAATSYSVTPTSYYVPTSLAYYWPTAYYEPTVAYYAPTVSYYAPTVIDYPAVTTATACNEAPTRIVRATPSAPVRPAPSRGSARSKTPEVIDSQPAAAAESTGPPVSSRVDQAPNEAAGAKPGAVGAEPSPANPARLESFEGAKSNEAEGTPLSAPPPADEAKEKAVSPPNPPPAEPAPAPAPSPTKKAADALPAVPPPGQVPGNPLEVPLNMPSLGETTLRQVQKPVLGSPASVLNGVVKSGVTGDLVEGVPITLTNRSGQAVERNLETDAYGRFAVRLADGDWDVQVTMPSGRVYTVSRLSVRSGKIVDDAGRKIPSLVITR